MQEYHGYYSNKAALRAGKEFIYERPNGEKVTVTYISKNKNNDYGWSDAIYVGIVTKYITFRLLF